MKTLFILSCVVSLTFGCASWRRVEVGNSNGHGIHYETWKVSNWDGHRIE